MKPPEELTISIPATIAALPGLNLIERVILTRIHERPLCSNSSLATLTGLSERGVESTLSRLKKEGRIFSRGHGLFDEAFTHLDRQSQRFVALCETVPGIQEKASVMLKVHRTIILEVKAGWLEIAKLPTQERNRAVDQVVGKNLEKFSRIEQQMDSATAQGAQVDPERLLGG